jgi:hypothetical protein
MCGQAGTPSVGQQSIGPLSSVTRQEAAPLVTPDGHNKKLAGAYSGSIEWSDGSQKYSATKVRAEPYYYPSGSPP